MTPRTVVAALLAATLLLTACDDADDPTDVPPAESPADDSADGVPLDDIDVEAVRERASSLLGADPDTLPSDVRVARIGDEQFALTEDYVLGRLTVEIGDIDGSGKQVVSVEAELPDGPETFELAPG